MTANIIHTDEAKKKIKGKLEEISNAMVRKSGESELIKTIIDDISTEYELDKKIVRKMAKVFHDDSFKNAVAEADEFSVIYETITGQKSEE